MLCGPVDERLTLDATFTEHRAAVWGCSFAPDGQRLATSSMDGTVRLWDLGTGTSANLVSSVCVHDNGFCGSSWSPTGELVAACDESSVWVWNTDTRRCVARLAGLARDALACSFSPTGRWLAATVGLEPRVWDVATMEGRATLRGHRDLTCGCSWSPVDAETRLATCSTDGSVRVWDLETHQCVLALLGGGVDDYDLGYPVWGCAYGPGGRLLAAVSNDDRVRLWDAGTGQCVAAFGAPSRVSPALDTDPCFTCCSFAPDVDGTVLAAGSRGGALTLWDIGSRRLLTHRAEHTKQVVACAFAPGGQRLASVSDDGTVCLRTPGAS